MPKSSASHSKPPNSSDSESDDEAQTFHDASTHFAPEDEAALVSESNVTKSEANTLFSQQRYSEAISTYDRALASCPNYLDYEIAVLKSNIAICHIYLEDWKNAVDSATEALDNLNRLHPLPEQIKPKENNNNQKNKQQSPPRQNSKTRSRETNGHKSDKDQDEAQEPDPSSRPIIEIPSDEDETSALTRLSLSDSRLHDITRIRLKALLRRAKARRSQPTWSSLTGAEEDYKLALMLLTNPPPNHHLPPTITTISSSSSSSPDLVTVKNALRSLPEEINQAKEKEMGEMMGKLKELGNGILKPFGLSTENFKMVKDEKTGGYSMNFEQGDGGRIDFFFGIRGRGGKGRAGGRLDLVAVSRDGKMIIGWWWWW